MRNRLLLLAAAVLLSACADDQHATAPASRSGLAGRSASGDAAPSGQATGNPQAKPIDQVGFTKVVTYFGAPVTLNPGQATSAQATCPAGTVVTGGGHDLDVQSVGTVPLLVRSRPLQSGNDPATGWLVTFSNTQAGSGTLQFWAWVACAS
jgi:hypothetical protein